MRVSGWVVAASVAALAAPIVIPAPASAAVGDLALVSRATGPAGASGDDNSGIENARSISISADGRYVAFESTADNLAPGSVDSVNEVFVRDLIENTTTRVSVALNGADVDGDSEEPSISADGRYVAFTSTATNLVTGDINGVADIFVRDLVANTTTLASRATGAGGTVSDSVSGQPSISADGQFVAFVSDSHLLDTVPDLQDRNWVFVRQLVAPFATTLVSRADGAAGNPSIDGDSEDPVMSADGKHVAFRSGADNLSTQDNDSLDNIFLRDLVAPFATTLVSRASGAGGPVADDRSQQPSISGDGRYVAFSSLATNLGGGNASDPDVFVRDVVANTTELVSVSRTGGAVAFGDSVEPSISGDGRYVSFESDAQDITADSLNFENNVYLRDLVTDTTSLVSRAAGSSGAAANHTSIHSKISRDGRYVAFASQADNLDVAGAPANKTDVFRRQVSEAAPKPSATCNGKVATIVGTPGNDVLVGTSGRDVIVGLGGHDRIRGLGGNDLICGGNGRDRINGGDGRDHIFGQFGTDRIRGAAGKDVLEGGKGKDRLFGGKGKDRLFGDRGNDRLAGGPGKDSLKGGPGHDNVVDPTGRTEN
jgi:Tol biopolymer transport system component